MKILYGITKSNFGGAQRYVFDLALETKKMGHDVAVICGGEGTLVDKLREADIQVYNIKNFGRDFSPIRDLGALLYFYKVLKNFKPDVLHINSAKVSGAGIFLGRLMRIPKIVFTAHGWAFNENRTSTSKIIIKTLSWLTVLGSHKTIAVSEKIRLEISKWPFVNKKILVIRNGVREFALLPREEARQKLLPNVHDQKLIVGTVSELHHIKGLDFLLTSWSEFIKESAGHLVIIGAGEEEENLKAQAKRLGITSSVDFKGFVDDARTLLKGFDIFTLTSRSEGLPYVILEAGIAKLPVIVSRVGGLNEVVQNNVSGLLIEVGDTNSLTTNLKRLANDKILRDELSQNLNARIEQEFTLEKMVHATLDLYA